MLDTVVSVPKPYMQGCIQDFFLGGGGGNLTDDLFCTCVYTPLPCILVNKSHCCDNKRYPLACVCNHIIRAIL